MKALIIDDIADLRDLIATLLEEWNIDSVQAENGRRALELLRSDGPFDFCTVDIFMPEMDGYAFVKAVRADKSLDKMKLLMVSTEVEKSGIVKALNLGADEYLMKPYTRDMVESKLQLLRLLP